ncbi:hypothetical protein [Paenibacillus sonchi]|uniref:hypothetical protein n=1 Tax=Paenibacillus sonchi TaxID=373687 RepID=UPI000307AE92|nr:hypothetical protein [Paenibacillus sonchi]
MMAVYTHELYNRISLGWNQDEKFIPEIAAKYHEYITEIFFSPPLALKLGNGKEHYKELELEAYREQLTEIKAAYPHIGLNMLYNFFCMGDHLKPDKIKKLLDIPQKLDVGIEMLSVSNLLLAEIIMKELPHIKLHLSVRLNIDTFEKVAFLVDKYGEDSIYCINLGRNSVYQLPLFQKLKREFPGIKYKIILNEFCTRDCLDSDLHSQMKAHNSYLHVERFLCASYQKHNWWRYFTGQGILPNDIHHWFGQMDIFKISSRWLPTDQIAKIMEFYLNGEEVSLGDIIYTIGQGGTRFRYNPEFMAEIDVDRKYPQDYWNRRSKCKFNCTECGYCKQVADSFLKGGSNNGTAVVSS